MCEAVEKIYFDAKKETAVRLLAMGLSVEQIAQATSLTVEEVEELKKSA